MGTLSELNDTIQKAGLWCEVMTAPQAIKDYPWTPCSVYLSTTLGTTSKFMGNSISLQCKDRGETGSMADGLVKIAYFYEKCIIPSNK